MKLEGKELIEIVSALTLLGGGFYAFGKLEGRLDELEKRQEALEMRVDPLRQLRVGKGDLCLKMLEQLGTLANGERRNEVQKQWSKLGCDGVQTNATIRSADAAALNEVAPVANHP